MSKFFEPCHLLYFAERMLESVDTLICDDVCDYNECLYRSIANRAYYAAFLTVFDRAIMWGYLEPEIEDHGKLFQFLSKFQRNIMNNDYNKRFDASFESLIELSNLRKIADYNLHYNFDVKTAKRSLELSHKVIENINKIPTSFK